MARKPVSMKLRFQVFMRDEFQCRYCGNSPPHVIVEVDHIVPVTGGGSDDIDNLVTACTDCNSGKGEMPLSESLAMERKIARKSKTDDEAALARFWFNLIAGESVRDGLNTELFKLLGVALQHNPPEKIRKTMERAFHMGASMHRDEFFTAGQYLRLFIDQDRLLGGEDEDARS